MSFLAQNRLSLTLTVKTRRITTVISAVKRPGTTLAMINAFALVDMNLARHVLTTEKSFYYREGECQPQTLAEFESVKIANPKGYCNLPCSQ